MLNQPRKVRVDIPFIQCLSAEGKLTTKKPIPLASDLEHLTSLYQHMLKTRLFDQKAIHLQRTGQLGTYPSSYGQEAIFTALGDAMQPEDIFAPYYREHGTLLMRGLAMTDIYQYWGGDECGSLYPNNPHDFPPCIPIASQCLHGVGAGFAIKYRKEPRVAVTTIGDGGTSKGDFYEAMNLAGAWQLPVVFVINNNQWAISIPRAEQTAADTLAQKAIAANLACIQVDGNDVIATTTVFQEAIAQTRQDGQPRLIEALTYRLGDHTTADDASRYRNPSTLEKAMNEEPVLRLRRYLTAQNAWDDEKEQQLKNTLANEVEQAVSDYLALAPPKNTAMFDNLYATLPKALAQQYQSVKEQDNE